MPHANNLGRNYLVLPHVMELLARVAGNPYRAMASHIKLNGEDA